ncbi:DUF3592 domain-containing protein [Amycolatopsis sp. NPDC052450]|uniref:DUF3592 domain-containing protein n=1 Tax=Amycolatopsis sp. NPDC052450 TaxID=3363937 RepID=UPI0037C9791B
MEDCPEGFPEGSIGAIILPAFSCRTSCHAIVRSVNDFPLFAGWAGIGCLFLAFLSRFVSRVLLLRYGERCQGRLVRFRETSGDHPRTMAVYQFSPKGGGVLEFEEEASRSYGENSLVVVRYWRFNPRRTASTTGPGGTWQPLVGDLFPLFVTGTLFAGFTYVLFGGV